MTTPTTGTNTRTTHMTITFPPGIGPIDPPAAVREPRRPVPAAPSGAATLEEIR